MIALLFHPVATSMHGSYVLLVAVLSVLAMGVGSIVQWAGQHPKAARLLTALLVAAGIGTAVLGAQAVCCRGCDEFWMRFWLCV